MSTKSPTKILCAFLYWNGDKRQIENLARLSCDLLEEPTDQAECLFVARYDAAAPTAGIQYRCKEKFAHSDVWTCDRRGEGFPAGCNEMAYGLLNYIYIQRHMNQKFKDISAVLILEGDCVITRPTWVTELCAAWDDAYARGKRIVGSVQPMNKEYDVKQHVNAVAMYDPEILRLIPTMVGGPQHIGWDCYHGDKTVPMAVDSELFHLDYQRPTITEDELFNITPKGDPTPNSFPLIYHGVKDMSGLMAVKNRYKLNETK